MGTTLKVLGIVVGLIAALLTWMSNGDSGRLFYKSFCCRTLSGGIDKLFQPSNKYVSKQAVERTVGWQKFFYLEKDKDSEFEAMKDFILRSVKSKSDIYANVKVIAQYQAKSLVSDVTNTNFTFRPVFFVKETANNKGLAFTDATYNDMIKDAVLVTYEERLTQDLDNHFSSGLKTLAFWSIIIGVVLNLWAFLPTVKKV
ncbi:MAG: hypothetical protein V1685_03210 [Parcubacteria group bacterium]